MGVRSFFFVVVFCEFSPQSMCVLSRQKTYLTFLDFWLLKKLHISGESQFVILEIFLESKCFFFQKVFPPEPPQFFSPTCFFGERCDAHALTHTLTHTDTHTGTPAHIRSVTHTYTRTPTLTHTSQKNLQKKRQTVNFRKRPISCVVFLSRNRIGMDAFSQKSMRNIISLVQELFCAS